MAGESHVGVGDHPYFFLSYRRSEYRPEGAPDPDRWVKKLFWALCSDVYQLTATSNPGFMDQQGIPLGSSWPDKLAEALAVCRVFVALLNPGYFASDYCGKEWAAFVQRVQMQGIEDGSHVAIVPVLWTPFRLEELPLAFRNMQVVPPGFPREYADEGLFALMKLKRYSAKYKECVWLLAKTIKKIAEDTRISACEPIDMKFLESAFPSYWTPGGIHRIRVMIVAYPASLSANDRSMDLNPVVARNSYYYGRRMNDWTPFKNRLDAMPIARYAEYLISSLGYRAVLEPFDDKLLDETPAASRQSPTVLIVDPWVTRVSEISDQLQIIDRDPTHVVVPWNVEDDETTREESRLLQDLWAVLPKSLALKGSTSRVPTLDRFRDALAEAVNGAIAKHLKIATAYPPTRPPSMGRPPTLEGPES